MQFQVPQFIETEDKIVGPLSLRQFMYVGGAIGLSFLFYFTLGLFLWFLFSIVVLGLGVALAFVRINSQPLVRVLISAAHYYWKPQTYVWQPEHPELPKTESNLKTALGASFSLENILSGIALKAAWRAATTGSRAADATDLTKRFFEPKHARYQVFRRLTGERAVARRVDYK